MYFRNIINRIIKIKKVIHNTTTYEEHKKELSFISIEKKDKENLSQIKPMKIHVS